MGGVVDEVGELTGVGFEVVEFVEFADGVVDEFVALIADHAAGIGAAFGAKVLGEGEGARREGVGGEGGEVLADEGGRRRDAGGGEDGAGGVDGAGSKGIACGAWGEASGPAQEERDVGDVLVEAEVFVHEAVAAAEVAVVGGVDDEGAGGESGGVEVGEDAADVVVEFGDDAEVEADDGGPLVPGPVFEAPDAALAAEDAGFAVEGVGETGPRGDGGGGVE